MADIFDEIAGVVDTGVSTPDAVLAGDIFDEIARSAYAPAAVESDAAALGKAAASGFGGMLGVVDEFMPQFYREGGRGRVAAPHIFGLFEKKDTPVSFKRDFEQLISDTGLIPENVKPASEIGKAAYSGVEAAAGAAPFGPAAMLFSGAMGTLGGYGGEKTAEYMGANPETGRVIGSTALQLTPAGIVKSGLARAAATQTTPFLAEFPGIKRLFSWLGSSGDEAAKAAVGRAVLDAAADPVALEASLKAAAAPADDLARLRTTAEVVQDSGIARLEDVTQSAKLDAPFKAMADQRQALREGRALKGYNPGESLYDTSKTLEKVVKSSAEVLDEAAEIAWSKLPDKAELVADHLNGELLSGLKEATLDGSIPLTGSAQGLLNRFFGQSKTGPMTFEQLQALRRKALEVGRAAKGDMTEGGQITRAVSSLVEDHIRKIIDTNAQVGLISPNDVALWEAARDATKVKKVAFGARAGGTGALEKLGLRGEDLKDAALIKEGLNSPDALNAHMKAAALGGEDVRPMYQQALKAELDGKRPTQWANIIDRRRKQWETVFSPDEMKAIDDVLYDIKSQTAREDLKSVGNSATVARLKGWGDVSKHKGIADLVNNDIVRNIPVIGGALEGARQGWESSDSTIGGVSKALLYGTAGAAIGNLFKSTATRASNTFDDLLIAALKDPRKMAEAIEAARPGQIQEALTKASIGAGKAAAVQGGAAGLNTLFKSIFPQQTSKPEGNEGKPVSTRDTSGENLYREMADMDEAPKAQVAIQEIEKEIDKDPYYSALYEAESGRNPKAKNPESTASGGFQFIKSTAKSIGLDDPFDLGKSFDAVKQFTDSHREVFGEDPALLYSAHYLGETVLRKVLKGLDLTEKEEAQVRYLQEKALPRFMRIYNKKARTTEV